MKEIKKCNYLRAGKTIKCGHCDPEHFTKIEDAAKEMGVKDFPKCDCICHSQPQAEYLNCQDCKDKKPHGHCLKCGKDILFCKCPERQNGNWVQPQAENWEIEFDKMFMPKGIKDEMGNFRSGLEPLPGITGNLNTIKSFISQKLKEASEEERERILKEITKVKETIYNMPNFYRVNERIYAEFVKLEQIINPT